ncbi:MAG: hypothetical protein HQK91_14145 [Nitrospirae bacterium]|nr:hypothetical protein [Nitrospirota bacterium]
MKEFSKTCPQLCGNGMCKQLSSIVMEGIYSLSNSYIQKYCKVGDYRRCPVLISPL